jgi:hypothetical protein
MNIQWTPREVDTMRQENERLRAALGRIANMPPNSQGDIENDDVGIWYAQVRDYARRALSESEGEMPTVERLRSALKDIREDVELALNHPHIQPQALLRMAGVLRHALGESEGDDG